MTMSQPKGNCEPMQGIKLSALFYVRTSVVPRSCWSDRMFFGSDGLDNTLFSHDEFECCATLAPSPRHDKFAAAVHDVPKDKKLSRSDLGKATLLAHERWNRSRENTALTLLLLSLLEGGTLWGPHFCSALWGPHRIYGFRVYSSFFNRRDLAHDPFTSNPWNEPAMNKHPNVDKLPYPKLALNP